MAALDGQDLMPVAVAVSSLKDPAAREGIEKLIATRRPAIILNATAFSALRDDGTTVLDAAGLRLERVIPTSQPISLLEAGPV